MYVLIFFFYFAMMVKIMCMHKLKIVTFEKYAIIYDKDKTNDDFFIKFYCDIPLHLTLGIYTVIAYL